MGAPDVEVDRAREQIEVVEPALAGRERRAEGLHGLGEHAPTERPSWTSAWPGPVLALDFTGHGELLVDGTADGTVEIAHFTPMTFSYTGGGLTCGYEVGPAVSDDYIAPARFTGSSSPSDAR